MVWKQGERVIYADRVHIGKELRASIVENTSLVLSGVDTQYTGKLNFHTSLGTAYLKKLIGVQSYSGGQLTSYSGLFIE